MQYIPRELDLDKLLKKKSLFLFGPRATGKTTLVQHQLPGARIYNLLDTRVFSRLMKDPGLIGEESASADPGVIVIDEIQKLPSLLDEAQRLILERDWKFLLTGSSARKLKRGAANLLAGKSLEDRLVSLTSHEIPGFDLVRYLNRGGLPGIYDGEDPAEDLENYVALYLKEEIQSESLIRSLPAFAVFLDAIALSNGEEISLESFGRDCGVSPGTVRNYLQILEDTWIGFSLPGFTKTKKRKAISRIKHYLFDVGVVNVLCRRGEIRPRSELFGKAFEQFIIQEIRAYLSYRRLRHPMSYWRSLSQFEVDLVVGTELALEIKSTFQVKDEDLKGLRALKEEGLIRHSMVVSQDSEERKTSDGIRIFPWEKFLNLLWSDTLLKSAQD